MGKYGYSDVRGFRDFVGFVKLCAPDMFPKRDGLAASDQWTLQLAFEGLWQGFELLASESVCGESSVVESCKSLTKCAEQAYLSGDVREGFMKLQEVEQLLATVKAGP